MSYYLYCVTVTYNMEKNNAIQLKKTKFKIVSSKVPILCFFRVDRKQNNISFDQGDGMVSRGKNILCDPLSGDEVIEDCSGEIPQKV